MAEREHAADRAFAPRRWRDFWLFVVVSFAIPILLVGSLLGAPQVYYAITGGPFDYFKLLAQTQHELGMDWVASSSLILWIAACARHPIFVTGLVYAAAPAIAAVIVAATTGAGGGLRAYWRRWRPYDGIGAARALGWYALAFALFMGGNLAIGAMLGVERAMTPLSHYLAPTFPILLLSGMFLDQGGLLEEGGWRGFGLPFLQAGRWSPLAANIVLGGIWTLWHLPRDAASHAGALGLDYLVGQLLPFAIGSVALSVVIAFFVNKVGGGVWMAVLIHSLANNSAQVGYLSPEASDAAILARFMYLKTGFMIAAAVAIVAIAGPALGLAGRAKRAM